MPLIYITGPTGAGKSTVRQKLTDLGYETYDVDADGMRVSIQSATEPAKTLLTIPPDTIRELKEKARDNIVFLCGTFPTDDEYVHNFDLIILLMIDGYEQEERIRNRTNSTYGKQTHQLEAALKWRDVQIHKYLNLGAIQINAAQTLDMVIAKVISLIPG